MLLLSLQCTTHKRYEALRAPRANCDACKRMWALATGGERGHILTVRLSPINFIPTFALRDMWDRAGSFRADGYSSDEITAELMRRD